jgi:hypothetical protein
MIDQIDCRISSGTPIHILQHAWDPDPLRLSGLAWGIAPPLSRLSSGLTQTKQCSIAKR